VAGIGRRCERVKSLLANNTVRPVRIPLAPPA
jgi:hypothetical protein